MKLDDNPQMVAMLNHAKGSLENKIRQAYNSGYSDGFKAGVFEAWDDMRKQLDKSLRQQFEQTDPQTEMEKSGSRAVQTARCLNCHNAKACKENHWEGCKYEPWKLIAIEDEPQTIQISPQTIQISPQTDCSWK